MTADELRARAAECYRFADLACSDLAETVRALGDEFERAAAEIDALAGRCPQAERLQ